CAGIVGLGEIVLLIEDILFEIGKNVDGPRGVFGDGARREAAERFMVVVQGQADLLEVIAAAHAVGGLPDLLHGRQQQGDQDANDHQQLDQGETVPGPAWDLDSTHEEAPLTKNAKRTMFNLFRSGRSIFVGDGATNRKSHSKRQENYYHAQVIETKKVTAFF